MAGYHTAGQQCYIHDTHRASSVIRRILISMQSRTAYLRHATFTVIQPLKNKDDFSHEAESTVLYTKIDCAFSILPRQRAQGLSNLASLTEDVRYFYELLFLGNRYMHAHCE